jgi:hypothetical protein
LDNPSDDAVVVEKVPAAHVKHAVPLPRPYVPAAQLVQAEPDQYVPAPQQTTLPEVVHWA